MVARVNLLKRETAEVGPETPSALTKPVRLISFAYE